MNSVEVLVWGFHSKIAIFAVTITPNYPRVSRLFFAGFFTLLLFHQTYSQNRFRTRYDVAVSAEAGGISPFVSANFEFVPYKTKTDFYVIRAGAGFISNTSQGVSVPVSLTYNVWLKNKTNCDAAPQRYFKEWFGEMGFGTSYVSFLGQKPKFYFAPIVGIRRQFSKWGESNVFFYKIHLTPTYTEQHLKFAAGFSIGQSL